VRRPSLHGPHGPQVQQFHGGLLGLLDAPPAADLVAAMAREHCEVADGIGASDTAFVTTNYGGNRTTPRQVCTQPSLKAAILQCSVQHYSVQSIP
jgi:hypothetical protein